MIDLSFAGLVGAFIGTAVAAVAYAPLLTYLQHALPGVASSERAGEPATRADERTAWQDIRLLRRCVLAVDISVFAGLGYWLADAIAG